MMVDFARTNGALVSKYRKDNVTHVIAATDANGACTRTLKMGCYNGMYGF
ncbi:putative BRCA1-associated, BRCT domain superfamily [Helianthus anomalus]